MSHESVVDRQIKCTQNLPFEVIAVPQYDDSRFINSASNKSNEPLNVKIRIRNKEEKAKKHGIISAQKLAANSGRKVRLISSDQTIMSFDFLEDPGTTKKQQKKSHKNIFHIFRPGRCLKTEDNNDDEYQYTPSSFSVINDIKDPSSAMADQKNIITEKIILKKNFSSITPTNTNTKTTGNFMGKCKPGGCLDPPFNEDKYSYEPATATSNASIDNKKDILTGEAKIDSLNEINNIKITTQEISENIRRTQVDNKASQENYANSLITYSSSPTDNYQIYKQSNDIKLKKRISSEDKAKISINEFSEIYFMPPKKDKVKLKEKTSAKNISETENKTVFEEEKGKPSVANHIYQKSPTLATDSSISLDSDVIKSQSNIKSYNFFSFVNEKDLEVKESCDDRHTFHDIKFSPVAHPSSECIDKNIISKTNSTIALPDIDKSGILQFVNKTTYSQKDISHKENKADTIVEIKEVDKSILQNNQQMLGKESTEGTLLDESEPSPVKNQNMQNISENYITTNIADPIPKIKYYEDSDKSDILQIVSKKTYSQKDISHNEIKADTTVEIKEVDTSILENNQQMLGQESVEGTMLDESEPTTVKNQNMRNISENYIATNIDDPIPKIKYDEDLDKSDILQFVSTKTYSQKDISHNKIKADTSVDIKEVDKSILENNQQILGKESIEATLLDESESSPVKNQNMQNISENYITTNIADPISKIKYYEDSLKAPQDSSKLENKGNTDKIKVTSLKSKEFQNIDKNQNLNNAIVVLKHSKASFKEQELITQKLIEISKTDEIIDTHSKSEDKNNLDNIDVSNSKHDIILQASESKYSLVKTQETLIKNSEDKIDKNEEKTLFIPNTEGGHPQSNMSTTTFTGVEETVLDHEEKLSKEIPSKPDTIFSGEYHKAPIDQQISIDILTSEEEDAAKNLNLDTKSITDTYKTLYDSLNKPIVSTPSEASTLKTSDVKFSLTSLIQDKRHETNGNSFEGDRRDNRTVETHKDLSLSKSLNSTIGSENNIEIINSNKHFNELNKSKSSLINNISHQITDNELKENTVSGISKVIENIEDKHKISLITTHDSYVPSLESYEMKQLEPNSLGNLGNTAEHARNKSSTDKAKQKTDIHYIVQQSVENHFDLSTYSSVAVDFGFRCSVDNDNKLIIRTFDTTIPSNDDVKTNVSIIKSIIRINDDEIKIPINFDTDLSMQIKKAEMTSKERISSKKITPKSSDKTLNKDSLLQETLNSVYESLIPLNKIIQNLKEEANVLSRQQTSLKEILATMEMKPKRLIHTDPQCGCEKK